MLIVACASRSCPLDLACTVRLHNEDKYLQGTQAHRGEDHLHTTLSLLFSTCTEFLFQRLHPSGVEIKVSPWTNVDVIRTKTVQQHMHTEA